MPLKLAIMRALLILIASVLIDSCAWAADVMPRRLYEVTTETGMPHLEENLRYAITREQRCLTQNELWSAFPILRHASLKGCKLAPERRPERRQERRQQDVLSYDLVCEGGQGTTGSATWHLGGNQITGTLNVQMGGKNMTFYQRVTARPLTECASGRKDSTRMPHAEFLAQSSHEEP